MSQLNRRRLLAFSGAAGLLAVARPAQALTGTEAGASEHPPYAGTVGLAPGHLAALTVVRYDDSSLPCKALINIFSFVCDGMRGAGTGVHSHTHDLQQVAQFEAALEPGQSHLLTLSHPDDVNGGGVFGKQLATITSKDPMDRRIQFVATISHQQGAGHVLGATLELVDTKTVQTTVTLVGFICDGF